MGNSSVLSIVFGIVATVFMAISYFTRGKFLLILFQALGNACITASFFVDSRFFAAAGVVVATVRMIVYGMITAKGKRIPWALIGAFEAVFITVFVITYINSPEPLDFMYLSGLLIVTALYRLDDPVVIKRVLLVPQTIYFFYELFSHSYGTLIETCVEVAAILIAVAFDFVRIYRARRRQQTQSVPSQDETDRKAVHKNG